MTRRPVLFTCLAVATLLAGACDPESPCVTGGDPPQAEVLLDRREVHLRNLRQLTFGGENAEAYFSFDGTRLVYQSTRDGLECDQIFVMNRDGSGNRMVSSGLGRTTCAYFLPGDDRILYASTHLAGDACPPRPDMSQGYVWPLYEGYDIFTVNLDGTGLERLTDTPGYDAEATVSPDGRLIVFTSLRDGDIDLYRMNIDGSDVRRLTDKLGYDGGAFFSPDSRRIVFRANRPRTDLEIRQYRALLGQGLIRPAALEIFVMNADGTDQVQVTANEAANFCPYYAPDGEHIIFSSNMDDPHGREFELYLIRVDGTGLERLTFTPEFDGFPMFSPDGKQLVFASNRGGKVKGETNIFLADWL